MTKSVLYIAMIFGVIFTLGSCKDETTQVVNTSQLDLDSLLVLFPDSVDLLVLKGNEYHANYEFDNALAVAAKAFRLDSANVNARLVYARALNNIPNRTVKDVALAQGHYLKVIEAEPANTEALVGVATTYGFQQDFDKAFEYTDAALKVDPKYRDAYVFKGSMFLNLGKTELAKSSYQTAIEQDPSFFEGYLRLGSIYQAEGNPICLEYFKSAYEINPKELETLYALAYAEQEFEKVEDAKSNYRTLVQNSEENDFYTARGLFHLGYIKQFNDNDVDSALYFYASALKTAPNYVEAIHNMGLCYEEKGDKSSALKSYAKALDINPEFTLSREAANRLK